MNAVFPAAAGSIALACAGVVGWDALQRPRPERIIWFVAFLLFAVAATAEVVGSALGWNSALVRLYYLSGAVLVVGLLALGEAYLLWPTRMPAATPGVALLLVAIAATAVWGAPVDSARLSEAGWHALERGPALVALTVGINAGGTLVLVGGALYSAFRMRSTNGWSRRAAGCVLIAAGAILVAMGGTLTRLGRPEYLYVAMSLGIAVIFAGVLLTRSLKGQVSAQWLRGIQGQQRSISPPAIGSWLPQAPDEGLRFIADHLLPLDDAAIADACRRWSATPIEGDALTREQARQTWVLRVALAESARERFDRLPLPVQAQLADLYRNVWSGDQRQLRPAPDAEMRRSLAILRPANDAEGEAR